MSDFISAYMQPNRFLLAGCTNTSNSQNSMTLYTLTFYEKQRNQGQDVFQVIRNFGDVRYMFPKNLNQYFLQWLSDTKLCREIWDWINLTSREGRM